MEYKEKYNIWDIVDVWKYAKQPHNEKTNKKICTSIIIAIRETLNSREYWVIEWINWDSPFRWTSNACLTPIKNI